MMDAAVADIVKSLGGAAIMWGTILVIFHSVRNPLLDRIPRLKEIGSAKFIEEAVAQAQSTSIATVTIGSSALISSPTPSDSTQTQNPKIKTVQHAEGALPTMITAEMLDLARRLALAWRFERTLRLIFSEQLEMLKAIKGRGSISERDVTPFYKKTNPQYQQNYSQEQFMAFLLNQNLVAPVTVNHGVSYTLRPDGEEFLKYIDGVSANVLLPGITDVGAGYKWGSNPPPLMTNEQPQKTVD